MKKTFSLVLAIVMAFSMVSVCSAAELTDNLANENLARVESVVASENGPALPVMTNGGATRATTYYGTNNGSTGGYLNGTFTVPAYCSGKLAKFTWSAGPQEGANANATFKLKVNGQTFYVASNSEPVTYNIGNLRAGTYSYSLTPYSGVSGQYAFALIFFTNG